MKIGRSTRVVLLLLSLITFAAPAAAQTAATQFTLRLGVIFH
jgi:hypothetical protein